MFLFWEELSVSIGFQASSLQPIQLDGEFENKAISLFHSLKWQRFTINIIKMGLSEETQHIGKTKRAKNLYNIIASADDLI